MGSSADTRQPPAWVGPQVRLAYELGFVTPEARG
jgi:hypothetical protein